jgi:hypothetical protein
MPIDEQTANPLPDEYLREIGLISVRWNQLELVIQMGLIKLLGKDFNDPRSHIPFVHMTLPHRLEVLRSLVQEYAKGYGGTFLQEYEVIARKLETVKKQRNNLVHASWLTESEGKVSRMSMSAHGTFKHIHTRSSLKELKAVTDSIIDVGDALYKLVVANGESNISSPHTGQ